MGTNPVERNPVTAFLLGLGVIVGMFMGGGLVGSLMADLPILYGDWIGTAVGALLTFLVFTWFYSRYDDRARSE